MSFINQNVHKRFEHKHALQETLALLSGLTGYIRQMGMVNPEVVPLASFL